LVKTLNATQNAVAEHSPDISQFEEETDDDEDDETPDLGDDSTHL